MYKDRSKRIVSGWIIIAVTAVSFLFHAYSTGITGKTLKNGPGCECHSPTPFPEVTVVISGPDTLQPGETAQYSITLTGGELVRGGTNIAASNGILAPLFSDLRFEADELTHFEPKIPDAGSVTFEFNYTAPLQPGTETLYANGNSVNFNGNNTGDKWNFANNKIITVASPPPATFPLTVNISNGWNIVSIPGLHPINQNVTTWWPNKDPGAGVFKFNAGYQSVISVLPGAGYWMKHNGTQEYNTGDEWPAGILTVTHAPINGINGWNLIGGYEEQVAASGITTTPPGLVSGPVFKYVAGYQSASTLDPGYGYWIKLTAAGQIHIPEGTDAPVLAAKNRTDDMGRIVITDNSGNSYTLYSAGIETDLNYFELPPAPPAGMFDIRYSSQRYVENLAFPQSVEMMGVQYPVKVKAENIGIILSDESGKELARIKNGEEAVLNSISSKLFVSEDIIPSIYSLEQNYPNPFNPATIIRFSLPEKEINVRLTIYDALGQISALLVNSSLEAGVHEYQWNAGDASSGVYFYELRTESFRSVKKMLMVK